MTKARAIKQERTNELLAKRVRDIMDAEGLSQNAAANLIGLGATRFSQWLNDKYPGDVGNIENDVQRWLDSRKAESELTAKLPSAPAWYETPSAQAVIGALSFAQIAGAMTCIYGGAGLGKTTAIGQYAESSPNVWRIKATPATARPGPLLYRISVAIGARISTTIHILESSIIERIRDTRGLIVIDDAQHLCIRALDEIRSIHDATGIGIALVGNEVIYSQMTGGRRSAEFAQLFSRLSKRVQLTKPRDGDIDALLDAWGINDRASRDYCRQIGRKPGALRGLTYTLRMAAMFAAGAGESLNLTHIKAAWKDLAEGGA